MNVAFPYLSPFEPYDGIPIVCKKWKKPEVAEWMRACGCVVTINTSNVMVTLPEGTRRAVILPERQETQYYYLLPSGATLSEQTMRGALSTLSECERLHHEGENAQSTANS